MNAAIERILTLLPSSYKPFAGTQYPMPVSQALLGQMPDVPELRQWLLRVAEDEVKDTLEAVAIAAEVIESRSEDRDQFFLADDRVRGYVFMGAKWQAGWVLVAGDGVSDALVSKLKDAKYMVFSSRHDALRAQALPARETGAVHFLQLMARYAMIWGQIPPGEDHEMGHLLERDMPGAMVVMGEVGPVEGLLLLAIMKMGCPAIVGPEFPYDVGPRAVADSDAQVLEALGSFPNMRIRIVDGKELSLPAGADPAHFEEPIKPVRSLTGVFQLRPGQCDAGVAVSGDISSDRVAVIVEVSDAKLDLPVSAYLEEQALRYGSYLSDVKTRRDDGGMFRVELAEDVKLNPDSLGELIRAGLRHTFPRLGPIRVSIQFGKEAVAQEEAAAASFDRTRDAAILAESEESSEEFYACIDCQPFSHSHVCIITPDRPPMCGADRNATKAGALWGVEYRPWTRREVGGQELKRVILKGKAVAADAGEWAGVNQAARALTGGKVERVRIHSVCDAPHTSCGCFGALAFRIPGTEWIGVMDRSYKGEAPGGLTWSLLANQAGGKQSPGVTGISLAYLQSRKALAGEGGLSAVKWATTRCLETLRPNLSPGFSIATEENATTLAQLKDFLARR